MRVIDCKQGTIEWMKARAGIPTASELNELLDSKLEMRSGEMPKTYLARKLAEKWTGFPLETYGGGAMEQGSILEDEAIPWFEVDQDCDVRRVGFVTTDDGSFGCSPDGLTERSGLEIKCPQPHTHVKWLLSGGVPVQHLLQCEGGMYVTGMKLWTFVSYCRGFPAIVRTVNRESKSMDAIALAIESFNTQLEAGYDKLCEANGGSPVKRDEYVFA